MLKLYIPVSDEQPAATFSLQFNKDHIGPSGNLDMGTYVAHAFKEQKYYFKVSYDATMASTSLHLDRQGVDFQYVEALTKRGLIETRQYDGLNFLVGYEHSDLLGYVVTLF